MLENQALCKFVPLSLLARGKRLHNFAVFRDQDEAILALALSETEFPGEVTTTWIDNAEEHLCFHSENEVNYAFIPMSLVPADALAVFQAHLLSGATMKVYRLPSNESTETQGDSDTPHGQTP